MADDVKLRVGADTAKAREEFDKLSDSAKNIGETLKGALELGALTAAFSQLTGMIGGAVGAYKEAEEISNSLNASLQSQGIYSDALRERYNTLADAVQKRTKFGDDEVKAAFAATQGYLGQMEITEDLTSAVVDFAAAQKMDLVSAFQMVGKTVAGETNAFGRYGVAIDTSASESEKLAAITGALTEKFKGQAEAQADGLGSLDQLNNAWGDFIEMVGEAFAPAVTAVAKGLTEMINIVKENPKIAEFAAVLLGATTAIVGLTTAVVGVNFAMATFGATISAAILPITAAVVAVAGLYVAWNDNFLGIQEVTFGVFGALKGFFTNFFEFVGNLFNGFHLLLVGAFTLNPADIKTGFDGMKQAIADQVKVTVAAYKKGHDAKLAQIEAEKTAQTKADDAAVTSHVGATERKTKVSKKQLKELEEAQKKAREDGDEAAKVRFDTEEEYWEFKIKQAQEAPYEESDATEDALAKIEQARAEAEGYAAELHKVRLERIAAEEDSELVRVEKIKAAELDLQKELEGIRSKAGGLSEDVVDKGGKASEKDRKATEEGIKQLASTMRGVVDGFVNAGQGLKDFFGGNFINSLNGFIEDFANIPATLLGNFEALGTLMEGIPDEVDENGKVVKQGVKPLVDQMLAAVDKLLERVPKIVDSFVQKFPILVQKFAETFPLIVRTLLDALPKIMQTIADTAPTIAKTFMKAIIELVKSLPEIIEPLIDSIPEVIDAFLSEMPRLIEVIFEALPRLFKMIFDMIPGLVEVLAENLPSIVSELIEGIIGAVAEIIDAFITSFLLEGGLERIIGALLRMIPKLYIAFYEGIWEGILKAKDSFSNLTGQVFEKGAANFSKAGGALKMGASIFMGWINAFADWFQGLGEQFKSLGGKIGDGLRGGMGNFASDLGGKIAEAFKAAIGSLASLGGGGGGGGGLAGVLGSAGSALGLSVGGFVGRPAYASVGTFVPMIPRGSDVYPHMLAEGEAVINARSVASNPTLVGRLQNSAGPLGDGGQNVIVIRGDDEFGRMVEKALVRASSLGTSTLRFTSGGGS